MRMRKADSTLRSSRAVPHPSTNRALRRLTSEVRRDPVHSTRYGRQRNYPIASSQPTSISRRADSQEFFRLAFTSHAIQAEEGLPQLPKDAQNLTRRSAARTLFANRCESARIGPQIRLGPNGSVRIRADPLLLYRFSRWRFVPKMDCQRLKLIGRQGEDTTGYSSVGRASECSRCRNQMVPGSIPGGRIFDMQRLYRIIQSDTTEIQPEISYGLLGFPSDSKRARESKSMPKAHCTVFLTWILVEIVANSCTRL